MRDLSDGGLPALAFGIGARVVHIKTNGRIRGRVEEIRITAERTIARVIVDGMNGRDFDYDVRNLARELVCAHGKNEHEACSEGACSRGSAPRVSEDKS